MTVSSGWGGAGGGHSSPAAAVHAVKGWYSQTDHLLSACAGEVEGSPELLKYLSCPRTGGSSLSQPPKCLLRSSLPTGEIK